jgi:adenylate cyclase
LRARSMYWLIVVLALAGAAALRWIDPQPLARLRLVSFDTMQQLRPRRVDPAYPVRIVDIDERSLEVIGAWPWRREVLARLVERLFADGAKVVSFDFVLPYAEPDPLSALPAEIRDAPEIQPLLGKLAGFSGDRRLLAAIAGKPVVLGMIGRAGTSERAVISRAGFALLGSDPASFVPSFAAMTSNTQPLQEAASGLGALNWFPEHDQVVRKVPMLVRLGTELAPSLVAETMRLSTGAATIVVRSSTASGETPFVEETGITSVRIGHLQVPTDRSGQMWLSFTPHDPGRFRPAVDVLEGRVARNEIANRIVLIGTSAPGLFDLRATPIDPSIAGVEIHAQAIEQIIAGGVLHRPDLSTGLEVVFTVISGALLAFLVRRSGAVSGALMGAATLVLVLGTAWWVRMQYGFILDPTYPGLTLIAIYIFCSGFFYFRTSREKSQVRRAFSHYLAPSIVEELARRPEKLQLGGENRLVTIYRSDLAGFSKISEELTPQELVQLMNEYLTAMTDIIMEHGGFIDKYIGDAIDGVFGAPADDPDHALHAVQAALACRARLLKMDAAQIDTFRGRRLQQRIGLHTGVGIVGNIGSRRRFNYTVMGDSANLASRLEGANRFYGTTILASQATARLTGPAIVWREIDVVKVVGRLEPVGIYEPLGRSEALTGHQSSLLSSYAEGLRCWRSRDFAAAARHFETFSEHDPPARVFLERSLRHAHQPVPSDWEAINALDSK